jgi:hypothetical protein
LPGFGSESGSALVGVAGSGSRRAKGPTKIEKVETFYFLIAACSLLRAESFSFSFLIETLHPDSQL